MGFLISIVPLLESLLYLLLGLFQQNVASYLLNFVLPLSQLAKLLPDIRKGGFEGFPAKIAQPEWKPDFGPAHIHPSAGVTAVGARPFLIAYNINLGTNDLKIAEKIGKAIRASSGGSPAAAGSSC